MIDLGSLGGTLSKPTALSEVGHFLVGGVERRVAQRAELTRGALEALGITRSEDQLGSLNACSSCRFEADAGATAWLPCS